MPSYSQRSLSRLETCHQDLQTIFHYVIKKYDNTIVYGRRTAEEQFELYKRGRAQVGDSWFIHDKKNIVTYKDGYIKKSKHQPPEGEVLSMAVDAVPYHATYPHIRWSAVKSIAFFAGKVMGIAAMLKDYGHIEHSLIWGADWDDDQDVEEETFFDGAHFQLV